MCGRVLESYGWVALEKFQFSLASFHFLASELASWRVFIFSPVNSPTSKFSLKSFQYLASEFSFSR